jgi:hypothetical protein
VIVAFTGNKQVGKDTSADHLVRRYNFNKASFAGKLKMACALIFDLDLNMLDGTDEQKNELTHLRWDSFVEDLNFPKEGRADEEYLSHREVLQVVGTQVFREKYLNIWVDTTVNSFQEGKHYVISDLRFDNEAKAIREAGGIVVKVERPGFSGNGGVHISEQGVSGEHIDYVLHNSGDLKDVLSQVDEIMQMAFPAQIKKEVRTYPKSEEGSPVFELDVPDHIAKRAQHYYRVTNGHPGVLSDLVFQVCDYGVHTKIRDCFQVAVLLGEAKPDDVYNGMHTLVYINHEDTTEEGVILTHGLLRAIRQQSTIISGVSDDFSKCYIYGVLLYPDLQEALLGHEGCDDEDDFIVPYECLKPIRYLVENING